MTLTRARFGDSPVRRHTWRRSGPVLLGVAILTGPMTAVAPTPAMAAPSSTTTTNAPPPASSPTAFPAPMAAPSAPPPIAPPAPTTPTTAVPQPSRPLTIPASVPVPASNDPVSMAVAQARRTGTRAEVTSARTENTTTWANADGTLTSEITAGPIRVAQGKNLVPVDPTLVLANGKVAPRAAKGDIALSAGSASAGAEVASMAAGSSRLGVRWPGPLPAPTLAGDTATYANVVPDGDLVVKATTIGFEINLVLRRAPAAAPVIRLPLGFDGLTLSQDGKGQLALKDAAGKAVATSPAPVMSSAARDPRADEPTQAMVVDATIEAAAGGPQLVLRPDFAFLTDPATVYPVTIDPAGTLTSGLSTYVASDFPTTNYDGDSLLRVGTYNGGATKDRSFIRFDDGLIKGTQVTSATLDLYETWAFSCTPTPMWVDGAGVFNPGITWNTQPWVDGRHWNAESFAMGYTGCAQGPGWKHLDITGLVQAWQPGGPPQDALALLAPNEYDSYQWKKFTSVNSTTPPTITVNYNPAAPSAPQAVTAAPHNGSATISWTRPANAGAPQLNSYYVYVYTYPGYVFYTYAVTCGTCTSVSVPGVNGQQYQAFVAAYNGVLGPWAASNVYTDAAPPSIPRNIVATAANGSGTARWSPPASNGGVPVEQYLVVAYDIVGPTQVGGFWVCATCTSTTYPGLTNGHSYVIDVWAYNTPGGFGPPVGSNYISPGATDPLVGAGDRSFFTQQGFSLTDHMSASVNVGTGNLEIAVTDLVLPAIGGGLPLGRVYNSLAPAVGSSVWFSTAFGYDWRFNQAPDVRLVPTADGSVAYDTASGNVVIFTPSGGGLVAPVDLDATLVRNGDGTYTLTIAAGAEVLRFGADGNLLSDTDANGNAMTFAYPDGRRVTTITSTAGTAPGNTATIDYSGPNGRVASISVTADGVTRSVRYTYDSTGIGLTSVTDAANQVTAYTFDGASNLTQITGPAPVSQVTKFTYDSAHRVTSVTRVIPGYPDAVTRYDYTTPGHTKVTDPNNNPPTDDTFAPFGALLSVVDGRGATSTVGWTNQIKVATTTDPTQAPSLHTTNTWGGNAGQSLTKVTAMTGAFAETGYNAGSGITSRLPAWTTDSMGTPPAANSVGVATSYGYDPRGNLTSVTDPLQGVRTFVPNADGTVASSTSPANPTNPTTYGYTNHLLTSVTPPTGSSLAPSSATYDGNGRVRTSTSPKGMTTTLVYDALDRVKSESHSDGTPTISYVYDVSGNLTSRSDATGMTSYTYDAANRPLTKTTPAGAFSYGWDPAGNLISATDAAGTTTYHYNIVNRLDQVTEPAPSAHKDVFGYDAAGRRIDTWYNTGADVAYSGNTVIAPTSFAVHTHAAYGADGQLVSTTTTRASSDAAANRISDLSYSYLVPTTTSCPGEPAGRMTDKRQSVTNLLLTPAVTTTYCYDGNGRLTSASTAGGATYTYAFDADTNRTSGPEGTHTYNSAGQLTGPGITYDPDGNLTAGAGLSAGVYNGMDQTTSLTPSGGSATAYAYAGAGQAERVTAGPTTSLYGLLGLTVETTAGATTSYIRDSSGSLIAERTPGGDFYYVYDGQGSVIALVDPSGTQRASYTYDPYGDHATATAMNGVLPANPWRWSSSYLDATGLYKMGARYYDPRLGRFTQLDPAAGGSCNGYDYACGDPINRSDVSGTKGSSQPALPSEYASECDPLINTNYQELTSGLCTAYRYAKQTGNTLKDFYYQGYNSLQHPVDVTQRSAFNQAVAPYFESCVTGAAIGATAGTLGGPVAVAAGAAGNCGENLAATGFEKVFPDQARAISDASNALTGYGVAGQIVKFGLRGFRIPAF